MPIRRTFFSLALITCASYSIPAQAQCPKLTIQVDNDIAGSGYSEEKPKNWITHSVGACYKNYRYLSHTVGDGTRKGKAIWTPKISVTGWYEVTTSYRASGNRTTDADYVLYDDAGGTKKVTINQKTSGDCTKKVVGTIYCKVGGTCRLVLDGTDDSQSDAADLTSFKLTKCSGTPPKNPCSGISSTSAWEVCAWTTSTCSGTYNDGAGCAKYCAAAGMVCLARFGGEPGCKKEPNNKIACGVSNGHKSDWCECASPDAGVPPKPDAALAKKDGPLPPKKDGPLAPRPDVPALPVDGPVASKDTPVQLLDGPSASLPLPRTSITSGCSCEVEGQGGWGAWLVVALVVIGRRRRRRRQDLTPRPDARTRRYNPTSVNK